MGRRAHRDKGDVWAVISKLQLGGWYCLEIEGITLISGIQAILLKN